MHVQLTPFPWPSPRLRCKKILISRLDMAHIQLEHNTQIQVSGSVDDDPTHQHKHNCKLGGWTHNHIIIPYGVLIIKNRTCIGNRTSYCPCLQNWARCFQEKHTCNFILWNWQVWYLNPRPQHYFVNFMIPLILGT